MAEPKVPGHIAYELDARAEANPDFGVVTFENGDYPAEVVTYADIVVCGRKVADCLIRSGIAKGDTFALVMRNHPEYLYSLYAATVIGAVMIPIDPRTKGDRLRFMLKDSKSKGVICTARAIACRIRCNLCLIKNTTKHTKCTKKSSRSPQNPLLRDLRVLRGLYM